MKFDNSKFMTFYSKMMLILPLSTHKEIYVLLAKSGLLYQMAALGITHNPYKSLGPIVNFSMKN